MIEQDAKDKALAVLAEAAAGIDNISALVICWVDHEDVSTTFWCGGRINCIGLTSVMHQRIVAHYNADVFESEEGDD